MAAPVNVFDVFGAAPKAVAFAEEAGDDFTLADYEGATVVLDVVGVEQIDTKYGVKSAVRFSRVVVLGEGEPVVFDDVLLFQSAPVNQMKRLAGQRGIVASVVSYSNDHGGPFYKFGTPEPAGLAAAEKFLASDSAQF